MKRKPKIFQLSSSLTQISLNSVNVFLIRTPETLCLIDTGYLGSFPLIEAAFQSLGIKLEDIQHIILTHIHPDHTGELEKIKNLSGATTWMHELDAKIFREGKVFRSPIKITPGLINFIIYQRNIKRGPYQLPFTDIDETLSDGDQFPFLGPNRIIHTPGHTEGHICLLLEDEDCLIAGDLCVNVIGLTHAPIHEDLELATESIRKVSRFSFGKAGFGHGRPLLKNGSQRLRSAFKLGKA
ncbi:MAG: MBL fold metallo-hydrolase [Bacteroidota bacterium]